MKSVQPQSSSVLARVEQRRSELVAAAARLIAERGYHEITVADIVSELGVSHGTFYNYFESRRAILDAVIDAGFQAINERVIGDDAGPVATMDEFLAATMAMVRHLHEFLAEEPGLVRFVMFEAPSIDQQVVDKLGGFFDHLCALSQARLQQGIEAGFLHNDLDSEIVGRYLVSLVLATVIGALPEAALADIIRFGMGTD